MCKWRLIAAEASSLELNGLSNALTGNSADMFVFNTALGASNIDSIAGFASGTDHIQLALAMFGGIGVTGALSVTAFASGAGMTSAANADQHVIYNSTTGSLYYDADGAGGTASVAFATLSGVPAVTNTDFIVV